MIITLIGANFANSNIGTSNQWRIVKSLKGVTCSNSATTVNKGSTYSATFTVTSGYTFSSATVTMGGVDKTSSLVWNSGKTSATLSLTTTETSGNIYITITAISATGEEGSGSGSGDSGDTPINLTLYKSAIGSSILDYQDVWKMFKAAALNTLGSQIIGVDVSAYVGKTITITAAQSVISGANYAMFCSAFPNATVSSLAELEGYSQFGGASASDMIAEDRSILVESFNISTTSETTNSISKVVPANVKYLFFANLNAKCANPSVVVGNVEGASLATYTTQEGWCCMDYKTYFYLTANSTFQGYKSKVIALDVSGLVGKTLSITATQSVVDEAYYSFFTNALPSGISSIEQINGLAYSSTGKYDFSRDNLIESFNVAAEHQVVNTINKVVPTGAKYLFVNTLDKFGSSEIKLV